MAKLNLFVVSDIHAGNANGDDTYVPIEPPPARPNLHPLNDLVHLVDFHELKADYLVVPGDLANRADAGGLAYAWSKIQQLARSLEARVIAAPGNHDVITRVHVPDPRDPLKKLLPPFPTGDRLLDGRFWADGFCVLEEPDHRVVIIDSTADFPDHPGTFSSSAEEGEYKAAINRGGIRQSTIVALETELRTMARKLNLLVLHHHPLEHQLRSHMRDWHGAMRNGGELVALLSSHPASGRWLVIHGHKHIPQLVQDVRMSANGPVVLCAASLGHHLWAPITSFVNNQFHMISITDQRIPSVGSFTGTVSTYTWGYSIGWQLASKDARHLPPSAGFGYIADPSEVAMQVSEHMRATGTPLLRRPDLLSSFPMIPYLAPLDRTALDSALEDLGLHLESDERGEVAQVAEKAPAGGSP